MNAGWICPATAMLYLNRNDINEGNPLPVYISSSCLCVVPITHCVIEFKWVNREENSFKHQIRLVTQRHKGPSNSTKVSSDNQPLQRTVQCPATSLLDIRFNSKQHYSALFSCSLTCICPWNCQLFSFFPNYTLSNSLTDCIKYWSRWCLFS